VEDYSQRRERTYLFGQCCEECRRTLFIHGGAAILGKRVEDLLSVSLIAPPLLGSLAQQIGAADHRGGRGHWPSRHLHLRLGSAKSATGALGRSLPTSTGSIWIFELVSTTLISVAAAAGRALIGSPRAIGAAGLGRSGTGGESGPGARAVRFKGWLIWLLGIRHFRWRQTALLECSELFQ
jgi:hypothetical protein